MEFRVVLHLHRFFADYRSSCRVFITKKMKTIRDLQEHISGIFQIHADFYLESNNLYLPSSEDVRVLKEDDSIVAVPYDSPQQQISGASSVEPFNHSKGNFMEVRDFIYAKKSKHKRKSDRDTVQIVTTETGSAKKEKSTSVESHNTDKAGEPVATAVVKKKKKEGSEKENIAKKMESECSSDSDASKPLTTKPDSVSNFRRTCRKNIELMPISSSPKIVKSIRVYDAPVDLNHAQSADVEANPQNKAETIAETAAKSEIKEDKEFGNLQISQIISKSAETVKLFINEVQTQKEILASPLILKKEVTTTNSALEVGPQQPKDCLTLSASFATASESTVYVTDDSLESAAFAQVKRKRKRVRTRKKKPVDSETDSVEVTTRAVLIKPPVTSAAPSMHIRFEQEQQQNDVVELDPPNAAVAATAAPAAAKVDYQKLCNEEILQQPLMKYMLPKNGDVIAFKVYMLSKCYTPEISNFIIARVLRFCCDKRKVMVKLLVGAEQCQEPDGKFFMENCDNDEEGEGKEFSWSELIEPRLMFP